MLIIFSQRKYEENYFNALFFTVSILIDFKINYQCRKCRWFKVNNIIIFYFCIGFDYVSSVNYLFKETINIKQA